MIGPQSSRTDAQDHDLSAVLFLDAQAFLDRDMVEGVDNPVRSVGHETGTVLGDAELDLGIRNPLGGAENLQRDRSSLNVPEAPRS